MQHLQSSLILGTKMTHPEDEHFLKEHCRELISCIDTDNTDDLKELIESGVDPDKCEFQHIPALSYAIKKGKTDSILCLLTYGCDMNLKDCFDSRPLDYAVQTNNEKAVDLLLRYGAIGKTNPQNTPSGKALYFDVSDIFEAALTGNLHAFVYYYHLGANLHQVRSNKISLLHLCIEGNNPKLLIYLLNKGMNIDQADKNGTSALMLATMDTSRFKLLEILIKRNATLDQRNNRHVSALTMAIKRFNIKAAILLVESGADVNIRDGIDTPLTLTHKAILQVIDTGLQKDLRDLETLLMSKGAHVNTSDENLLWSPLMLTSSHYQDDKTIAHIKLLIKLGAKIDQVDKNKRTSLMIASSLGRSEAIDLLVKHGADLDSYDKFGWTALMLAIYYNQKNVVKLLLQNGADVNISTKKGLTAMKVAIDNERTSLIPILKDYGAVFPKE